MELSIYVDPMRRGRHVGREQMGAIIALAKEDPRTHRVVSIITGTNEGSIALHKKFGFRYAGTITEAGYKMGRYLDVGYWELAV